MRVKFPKQDIFIEINVHRGCQRLNYFFKTDKGVTDISKEFTKLGKKLEAKGKK